MATPGEPSKNPIVEFLVWLYDQTGFHWFTAVVYSPLHWLMGVFYRLQTFIKPILIWKDWQNRPLPKFPLPLSPDDLPIPTRSCDACGNYLGTLLGTYVDAKNLQAILPPGTSLDPVHIHDGQHALLMLFGYTENLHFVWWPFKGMSYLEYIIAVPHIRVDDDVEYVTRFFYLPLLHLNRLYPVILGWMLGYRKVWSRFTTTANTYSINSLFRGEKILDAEFSACPQIGGQKSEHWRELLEQPHLNPFLGDNLLLHYHWDWMNAKMQPVDATVTLHRDFPGIAAGTYQFKGIDLGQWSDGRAPIGAARFSSPFELLLPFSLGKLRGKLENNQAGPPAGSTQPPAD